MNNNSDKVIANILTGEASPEEKEYFKNWLNSSNKNQVEFNKLVLIHQLTKGNTINDSKRKVFIGIMNQIESDRRKKQTRKRYLSKISKFSIGIAATLLLFLSVIYFFKSDDDLPKSEITNNQKIIKSNPAGQKSKIFLPDGSIVWLNSETTLIYDIDFNDTSRFIDLDGEAYFEVKRDESKPFVVRSKDITTTALGTSFNIRCFGMDEDVVVSLTRGKVLVKKEGERINDKSFVLLPGEGVLYDSKKPEELSKITIDIEGVKRWKDGVLELKDATLNESISILSRWYGVNFILENNPGRAWSVTGLFDNEYLDNVLNTLSFSQNFDYEINGKQIRITFKPNE